MPGVAHAGGKLYTFHYEATGMSFPLLSSPRTAHWTFDPFLALDLIVRLVEKPQEVIDLIHSHNMLAGLAISPETASNVITDSLGSSADLLLVMTVRPGHGGQKFMPECLEKVTQLRQRFPGKHIQVDGGVGAGNACQCAEAGELACPTWGSCEESCIEGVCLVVKQGQTSSWLERPYSVPKTLYRRYKICEQQSTAR